MDDFGDETRSCASAETLDRGARSRELQDARHEIREDGRRAPASEEAQEETVGVWAEHQQVGHAAAQAAVVVAVGPTHDVVHSRSRRMMNSWSSRLIRTVDVSDDATGLAEGILGDVSLHGRLSHTSTT